MSGRGETIAYYIGFSFPPVISRKPATGHASIEVEGDGWEELLVIELEERRDGWWGDPEGLEHQQLWRACLEHRAGRPIPDDELMAWLRSGPPSPGLREPAARLDAFLDAGLQLALPIG